MASLFESLWRTFTAMLYDNILGPTWCIVDGLDECDKDSLEVLLKKFRALFSTGLNESPSFHFDIITTSRSLLETMSEMLSCFPRINVDTDPSKVVLDKIHRFIQAKVDELSIHGHY